ncbi:ceramidase domain-containing protein [Oceanicoccus sagamiensis]|uniref:Alkaline phytoceramidase n=1 Tax=Oceanicoccus sagamiensis TaxID=716816 RepID=A0A1X9NCJ3_9GAMM|nr:ceramidase domain-containing protein [Oceanicoccus sagamiensis]ARN75748.1 hypothetical protein BST96_17525 [Oceanicoccus sagamiensis]
MEWSKQLDEYCERLGPDFWAEPVNAISNLSFIIGAVLAFRIGRQCNAHTLGSYWLTSILFFIGIGSFIYHTFATLLGMFLDMLPIYIFQLSFVVLYGAVIARQMGARPLWGSLALLGFFVVLTLGFMQFPSDMLNGSITYLSAWVCLLFAGLYHALTFTTRRFTLLLAAICLAISLSFRSIDMAVCESWGLGTHFVWHLLNGLTLYLSIRAYMDSTQASNRVAAAAAQIP